jgi:predicted ATPase/transcriptional regulator with XRE-family HTH domain
LGQDSVILPDRFTSFGELLKYLRRRAGLTQSELSIAVGYSDTQISRLENNQRVPDQTTLAALFFPALDIQDKPGWAQRLIDLALEARSLQGSSPAIVGKGSIPTNLLIQLTSFVGREKEIKHIQDHLTDRLSRSGDEKPSGTRLLTLVGSGGIGKTRLAVEAAARLAHSFPDGVWLIELAPLVEAGLVPQTVANTIGLREQGARSMIEALIDYLRQKQLLIVFDNCEHLVEACAHLGISLLQSCPQVRLLATSREKLGIPGEALFRVPSLSTPSLQPSIPTDTLMEYDAVELFVARAKAAQPDFTLTPENGAGVARICSQLDGLPLAIELAAARVNVLAVDQIAARLSDSFRLLTGGARTALPRHQTLRATIEWSYNLLSDAERMLLRRLAIFPGGWTLEAAEIVCSDHLISSDDVLSLLIQLTEKSMVIVDPSRRVGPRYRFLETTRQYMQEKLAASGELVAVRTRHLNYYLDRVKEAYPELIGSHPAGWLECIEAEHDNFRAALDWSLDDTVDSTVGYEIAAALGIFWELRGYYEEGRKRLGAVLSNPGAERGTLLRAQLILQAAWLASFMGDHQESATLLEECLPIFQQFNPEGLSGEAEVYNCYAVNGIDSGDYVFALSAAEKALKIAQNASDLRGAALALQNLGWGLLRIGDYDRAGIQLEEAVRLRKLLGLEANSPLQALGELEIRRGDIDLAERYLEESLRCSREIDYKWGIGATLGLLGWAAFIKQDLQRAIDRLVESLGVRRGIGDKGGMAWCIEKIAQCRLQEGQPELAASLFGCAEDLRLSVGAAIDPDFRIEYAESVKSIREQIGQDRFQVAWQRGKGLVVEELVAPASVAEE